LQFCVPKLPTRDLHFPDCAINSFIFGFPRFHLLLLFPVSCPTNHSQLQAVKKIQDKANAFVRTRFPKVCIHGIKIKKNEDKYIFKAYLKLDPNNLFRYSPNLLTVMIVTGLILIQVITLLIQTEWPRFGYETKTSYDFFEADPKLTSQVFYYQDKALTHIIRLSVRYV